MEERYAYHEAGHLVLSLSERYGQKYNTNNLVHINLRQVKGLSFYVDLHNDISYPKATNEDEYLKLKTEALKVIGGIVSEKVFCKNDVSLFGEKDFDNRRKLGWIDDLRKFHKIMETVHFYEHKEFPKQDDESFKKEFVQSQIEYLKNNSKLQEQIELVKDELLKKKEIKGQDLQNLVAKLHETG